MNERTDEQKSPCVLQDFVPFGAAAQKADFRPEKGDFRPERADFRPERAWGGGRRDGRTNRRTNKWSNEQKSPCVLQDFVPFGAAAQKEMTHASLQKYPITC